MISDCRSKRDVARIDLRRLFNLKIQKNARFDGLPVGIVYGLKANGNGAMNSGGDMSSKTGSIGNQNL